MRQASRKQNIGRGRKKASQVITLYFCLFFRPSVYWGNKTYNKKWDTPRHNKIHNKKLQKHISTFLFTITITLNGLQDTHPATAISTRFLIPHCSNISCCEVSSPNAALNVNGLIWPKLLSICKGNITTWRKQNQN